MRRHLSFLLIVLCSSVLAFAGDAPKPAEFKPGAKVFIASMPDSFDAFLKAALLKKKVPLVLVDAPEKAEFEIKGHSETQKASTAKKAIMLDWHSDEQASISVTDLGTSEVVFSYSVNKKSSAHGKQSTAEACAKHLKEKLEKK